jgi:hypothetical protein
MEALRALKARLTAVCATCHPQDITAELGRYADYGPAWTRAFCNSPSPISFIRRIPIVTGNVSDE